MRRAFPAVVAAFTILVAAGSAWQTAQTQPAFEVASVRLTPKDSLGFTSSSPSETGRYAITNVSLDFLVQVAFGVPWNQIAGVDKLGTDHYDIAAKAEDGVILTRDQLQPRLRQLLEQRFKLTTHRETKDFDGFVLTVAKGGPKLKPSTGSTEPGMTYPGGMQIQNTMMSAFASFLASPLGRPVIDKTGIQGEYDIKLEYSRDADTDSPIPSIFTAVQEQLGLKLESRKVPVELLVIDHVERIPAEN